MPRHAFRFPAEVRENVKKHVNDAVASVRLDGWGQEAAYVAALALALEGIAYCGPNGKVEFRSTIIRDRGPGAAESWSGADMAVIADISDGKMHVRKAVLIQAKWGNLNKLPRREAKRLCSQVGDMRKQTRSPKIMDIPEHGGIADPGVYSGNIYCAGGHPRRFRLGDYFVQRILTTLDGDTCRKFVDAVQNSDLHKLHVSVTKECRESPSPNIGGRD